MNELVEEETGALSRSKFLLGLIVIMTAVYLQYVLPDMGLIFNMLLVYGVPILVVGYLWGRPIIHRSLNRMKDAFKYGFASYGGFTALSFGIVFLILLALIFIDPSALDALNNPNPILNTSPENAWLLVWISFLVIGPAEEFLFRGFAYGGLLHLFGNRHWILLAFLSSVLFAMVHLYYAIEYGIVSLVMFTQLVTFGMAMAVVYYLSDGNLLVPAFIHGLFDATGFLTTAVSLEVGSTLRLDLLFFSLLVLGIVVFQWFRNREVPY